MRLSLILWLWLFSLPVSSVASVDSELQNTIEGTLQDEQLTGVAWTLVHPGGEVTTGSAGISNAITQTSFTEESRFHVGSVTKTVFATGVLRLVSLGKIALDTPVQHYLPNLKLSNPWTESTPVTVRHLLDHTSGMEDAHFWQLFSELPEAKGPLTNSLPDSPIAIQSEPGRRFSYSNTGYTILAMVIEAVTDLPYEQYLDQNLLAPLGMTDSTFEFTTPTDPNAYKRLVWGHLDLDTPFAAPPMYLRPAGQFTTTAADLGRLASFLLGEGRLPDGSRFIDSNLVNQRGLTKTTEAFRHGLEASYALGLARRDRNGVVGFCHTGSIVGFYAMLCVYPEEQKAFAYSVNTDSETADYSKLTAHLIDKLELDLAQQPAEQDLPHDIDEWTGYYRISPVRFRLFEYIDTVFGLRRLQPGPDGTSMDFISLQASSRHLLYSGDNVYRATDRTTNSHVFYRDADGNPVISDGFHSFDKVSSTFAYYHVGVLIAGLAGVMCIVFIGMFTVIVNLSQFRQSPVFPAFCGVTALTLPVPVFFTQSFMALGDFTPASGLLAVVTTTLPLAMIWTLFRVYQDPSRRTQSLAVGAAATLVLLWWFDMASFGQMPFLMWM